MGQDLNLIFTELQNKIKKSKIDERKKAKLLQELLLLNNIYNDLEVDPAHLDIYENLVKNGKELLKEKSLSNTKKLDYFLRYCHAAFYDFNDNLKPLNKIIRSYLVTCIMFFALSPQYFSFILPLIFILPIFSGLQGMKKRTRSGLILALSVLPIAMLTAMAWLKNAYLASADFNSFFLSISQQYNLALATAKNLTLICIFLSFFLLFSTIYTFIVALKHRRMFV